MENAGKTECRQCRMKLELRSFCGIQMKKVRQKTCHIIAGAKSEHLSSNHLLLRRDHGD